MRKSTTLLCAAAIGLAGCGGDDEETNLAQAAANAANAANTAASDAGNAASEAGNAATDAADDAANQGPGKAKAPPLRIPPGKGPPVRIIPGKGPVKVEFRGCTRIVQVEKPGGCMVVRSGTETYDIDSARPRPNRDSAIAGRGIYDPKTVGLCPGKHLTQVQWGYTRALCPKGGPVRRPG